MHPAVSVIIFTVFSGAGFGMLAIIGFGQPLGFAYSNNGIDVFILCGLGAGLAVAGLVSSTFHLGRPHKAWRAFSQWRSSWLSREGIAAVTTLILFGIYTLIWITQGERIVWLGIVIAIGSVFTVFTTAMIYTQMRTVPHWNTFLTPMVYLSFSLCLGYLLTTGIGQQYSGVQNFEALPAILLLIIAWGIKLLWWQRAAKGSFGGVSPSNSSISTATGLGKIGKVRLLDRPHTGPNYLTKEMVHVIGRKHASRLRMISLLVGGFIPLLITIMAYLGIFPQMTMFVAALSMIAGLLAERWLFFAEAEHSVSLYY